MNNAGLSNLANTLNTWVGNLQKIGLPVAATIAIAFCSVFWILLATSSDDEKRAKWKKALKWAGFAFLGLICLLTLSSVILSTISSAVTTTK